MSGLSSSRKLWVPSLCTALGGEQEEISGHTLHYDTSYGELARPFILL